MRIGTAIRYAAGTAAALIFSATLAIASWFGPSWEDDIKKVDACHEAVNNDPGLQALHAKFTGGNSSSFDQLANDEQPTEEEVVLLRSRIERKAVCREIHRKAVAEHHPWMLSTLSRLFFQQDVVLVELVKKRVSWGNGNKLMREAWLGFEQAWNAYAKARSDEERRRTVKALEDLNDTIQSQNPTPTSPPGTGHVTCRWIGPTLYCDQY